MTTVTNQTGSFSGPIYTVGTNGMSRVPYWVGVRTPEPSTGLQVRVEVTDSLGFTDVQYSAMLDGSIAGSVRGSFIFENGSGNGTFYVDVFGSPSPEYDILFATNDG